MKNSKMTSSVQNVPDVYCCCKTAPSWIFVYKNEQFYSICDTHFTSKEYRCLVKYVINLRTRKCYLPDQIFGSGHGFSLALENMRNESE